MDRQGLKIYFAGDLFDAKDIGGNLLLAGALEKYSANRYKVMLPQDGECEVTMRTAKSIRDADFKLLFNCDCLVANFDGHDLDSGTVVEFCFAKMLDMPAVLLRTDFRNSGDAELPDGDPWNLMCSIYPRTEVLHINAMMRYHECKGRFSQPAEVLEDFYRSIAGETVQALDRATSKKSWLKADDIARQLDMTVKSIGGTLPEIFTAEAIADLSCRKAASGLYTQE